uniref:Reverse transcriptase Ty1/copia-type domain-containing protein n=1 Tax=Tanacetum cinerariifolium TaxID=118510 RepID=A0A6L2NTT6_TANCI|nr:hypothetical protein [Tanacetum cinerariifolium]
MVVYIDSLTNSMNYQPVSAGNRTNGNAGIEINSNAGQVREEKVSDQEYILLPLLNTCLNVPSSYEEVESSPKDDAVKKSTAQPTFVEGSKINDLGSLDQQMKSTDDLENTNINAASSSFSHPAALDDFSKMTNLEDTGIFDDAYDDRDEGAEADYNNLEIVISVSPIPFTRIHKDHPKEQIIREVYSAIQTRKMAKQNEAGLITFINKQRRTNHKDFQNCLFACFLSQMEPKKTLVDLPHEKRAIGTKWVYRNKRDQRGVIVRNKARLVAQGHRQEEGIDYDEVFALVARIEAIRLFLAYAYFMDFTVYQMDVKSSFLYGTIKEVVYVSQPSSFMDPEFPDRVYKVEKALYCLHQAHRACVKSASTPIDTHNPLSKDADGTDVDVHLCASLDKKSTTGGCQFLGSRQVLWLQNQLLNYGYNFMQTKIHIDNESSICVVKNHVYHSKTKHIEIKHHFIKDSYEKRLIEMVKIHTDYNVTDLLTKAFDVTRMECKSGQVMKIGLKLKGYLNNDGYADLVQHAEKKELAISGQMATGKEFLNLLMVGSLPKTINLKFIEQHNMVVYFEKSDDNTEFHQIVDFLSSCSINYALTISSTIYSSYIEQFWSTASSKTINFVKQIHVNVDGKAVVISKSSVRNDLLFNDEDGGDNVERAITTDASLEAALTVITYLRPRPQQCLILTFLREWIHVAVPGAKKPCEVLMFRLDIVPPTPYDSPLTGGYTPGSDEGRLKLDALMEIYTTLSNRVTTLENDHSSTKDVYHKAFITLTKRVKKLETQLKQKRSRAVIHSSDEEEPREVHETADPLKDDDDVTLAETLLNIKRSTSKDKGKAQKLHAEELAKEAARQEHEKYNLEKALELQRQLDKRSYEEIWISSSIKKLKETKLDEQKEEEVEAQVDSDQEVEEVKLYMRIVLDEDIVIDAIPLATKPSVIVEYKIVKEGKISTYHITRADGKVLMIDWLSIVETDKVNHIVETNILKLVVEIDSFVMSSDKFEDETRSSDGLQPKQADLSDVHALNELHLHEIHVVPSKQEADQY